MTSQPVHCQPPRRNVKRFVDDEWLRQVAEAASLDANGTPVELLGDYLPLLAEAAASGSEPNSTQLDAIDLLGRRAAELGVSAGSAVQLYLSAARRLWQELPLVIRSRDAETVRAAAEAVLGVVDAAVARLAGGYAESRRQMVRWEETLRAEFIDDLLRGDGDVGRLVERGEPFGMDLTGSHQVALAAPTGLITNAAQALSSLEHAIVAHVGDRDVLVAIKDGWIVAVAPFDTRVRRSPRAGLGDLMQSELHRLSHGQRWRVTVGRPYSGVYGIPRSYEEAREALTMAVRLGLDTRVIHAEQLLIYRVLLRDQPAITDLVQSILGALVQSRGGAAPLLSTLEAYFASGCVITETARRLHLSARAVSYRLNRIATLTGHDPTEPAQRFTLNAAVLGAKLLDWPKRDLCATQ